MLEETNPDTERVQAEILRAMTPQQRFALMSSMTDTAVSLSRRAIRRAHPGASEAELLLEFLAAHYGPDLAGRVRAFLRSRRR